ncbi:hypothetical protein ACLMJK_009615 [Lecanora helva]
METYEVGEQTNGSFRDSALVGQAPSSHPDQEFGGRNAGKDKESTEDASYVFCGCGEWSLAYEFESHLEMHYAESVNFEETARRVSSSSAAPRRTIHYGKASSCGMETTPSSPSRDIVSSLQKNAPLPSIANRRSRGESRKSQGIVQDLIGALRHSSAPPSRRSSRAECQKDPRRLGRKELGPHAHERQMPGWLRKQLELGAKVTVFNQISLDGRILRVETIANEFRGIIPVLAQLCEQDPALSRAYLCHPDVTHVVKMSKEGGFCGYRNIQMLVSFIRDTCSQGYEHFQGRLPSIIKLQNMIESAWDQGFNPTGRIETGGILGTRKYIGTPEVCHSIPERRSVGH